MTSLNAGQRSLMKVARQLCIPALAAAVALSVVPVAPHTVAAASAQEVTTAVTSTTAAAATATPTATATATPTAEIAQENVPVLTINGYDTESNFAAPNVRVTTTASGLLPGPQYQIKWYDAAENELTDKSCAPMDASDFGTLPSCTFDVGDRVSGPLAQKETYTAKLFIVGEDGATGALPIAQDSFTVDPNKLVALQGDLPAQAVTGIQRTVGSAKQCAPAAVSVAIPLLLSVPLGAAAQLNIPGVTEFVAQFQSNIAALRNQVNAQLGNANVPWPVELLPVRDFLLQAGAVVGGIAAIALAPLLINWLVDACSPVAVRGPSDGSAQN